MGCQTAGREIEFVKIHEDKEVARRRRRRANRTKKKKEKKKAKGGGEEGEWGEKEEEEGGVVSDEHSSAFVLKCSAKVVTFAFHPKRFECTAVTHDNKFETYSVTPPSVSGGDRTAFSANQETGAHLHGHRSDVRGLALSSDNSLLASVSKKEVKIWSVGGGGGRGGEEREGEGWSCVQSMTGGFGLCVSFVPGDRHVVVGTKDGWLQLFSLSAGVMVWGEDCHSGAAVWSLQVFLGGGCWWKIINFLFVIMIIAFYFG